MKKEKKDSLVEQFEAAFARYIAVKHAIAVSSGKTALYLSLKVLGAMPRDEIIVPAYTVPEVIEVIVLSGILPVFIDIRLEDATMDPALIEEKITPRTRFILATHMYGNPCQIDKILEVAQKHNLKVIEDAAQACGAEFHGKKTGGFGKVGYFSFGLIKNLNTLGGGMIVTDDDYLASAVRKERRAFRPVSRGQLIKSLLTVLLLWTFTHPFVFSLIIYPLFCAGLRRWENRISSRMFKSRRLTGKEMDRLKRNFSPEQAALGLRRLEEINIVNDDKIKKALLLNRCLSPIKEVRILKERRDVRNIYLNYVISVKERGRLAEYLFSKGIDVIPGFVVSCAAMDAFNEFRCDCPNSLLLEKENLYLPIYHSLTSEDALRIADSIKNYYRLKKGAA